MESSEDDEDFPTHEWITPQSSVNSVFQSDTEKSIRKICTDLLDLKDAVENLSGNMQSKFLAFLRVSEEVTEAEQEIIELQKHVTAQGILVHDLMSGVCHELEIWNKWNSENPVSEEDVHITDLDNVPYDESEDTKVTFLETIDVLLAEHKVEETLLALEAEEKQSTELNDPREDSSAVASSYKAAFLERKAMLVDQLIEISEQSSICIPELKKALSGLAKLGKSSVAHQLLLKSCGTRLQKKVESFLPLCSIHSETYAATLSQIVFSMISLAARESCSLFGDVAANQNRLVQWAECEIESFFLLVKENAPLSETATALRSASICLQASLTHCSSLESQGLKFSNLLMVMLRPYVEEVLNMNFRRARRMIVELVRSDRTMVYSPLPVSPLSTSVSSEFMLTSTGKNFLLIVRDILEQLTPMAILDFGGSILGKLLTLYDKYVETLIKALPGPSEDEHIMEDREGIDIRAETDAQQLALLGTAFTVSEELLPTVVSEFFLPKGVNKEGAGGPYENIFPVAISSVEYKDWRKHLQHSWDKLRDHFCRQYVLTFIYSREGNARLDSWMYLDGKGDDLFWDADPLPSLPFQALFARLQQLSSVAGDVLLGKEKVQKVLLSRLTETVVMWLSEEQEFWDVFKDESIHLQPFGLQQLILDMHFIVEIAVCGGYPSRNINQIVSAIITKAIGAFSSKGVDPQSALPEDEWFVDTAKTAINKLMLRSSCSESSEVDDHIIMHEDISDSDESLSCPSVLESDDSFASANMDEIDSPVYSSEPEG